MIVLHVTPAGNTASIMRLGILTRYAQSAWRRCWVCDPCREDWARKHVALRHGCNPCECTVLKLYVEEGKLHSQLPGLYWLEQDIQPEAIQEVKFGVPVADAMGW